MLLAAQVAGLITEINAAGRSANSGAMTIGQLCDHFEQRELVREITRCSHATKKASEERSNGHLLPMLRVPRQHSHVHRVESPRIVQFTGTEKIARANQ